MILWWWWILFSFLGDGYKWVHGQFDSNGFLNIDCGLSANDSYIDDSTKLSYISDAQFIDTGMSRNISKEYVTSSLSRQYLTVRSFDSGTRNCYSLKSLVPDSKYLLRATFLYGNYDGLNKFAMFDLHIGVNFWRTINISDAVTPIIAEAITVVPDDYVQICLVNTSGGTPFISLLELRPLKDGIYQLANSTQSISLVKRLNAGPKNMTIIRYPDDQYDRMWEPWSKPQWTGLTTSSRLSSMLIDVFGVPSAVMQTAVTPVNSSMLEFDWDMDPLYKTPSYWFALHFCEIQLLDKNQSRWFNITVDGMMWLSQPYSPPYQVIDAVFGKKALSLPRYNVSLVATENSTQPPLLNAFELFIVLPVANVPTDGGDVSTINAIKVKYQIKKNWVGDPCAPETYAWDGLTCNYAPSSAPRITTLNLASSGLTGELTPLFSDLKALQSLNLSYNNLTGPIPDALSQLASLTLLDLTGNQITGPIPDVLLKKSQAGKLTLRVGHDANLCYNATACGSNEQKKSNGSIRLVAIVTPVLVSLVLVAVVLLLLHQFKKQKDKATGRVPHSDLSKAGSGDNFVQLNTRQFTYTELVEITNNFSRILGKGGFGTVFHGILANRTEVAVKVRSESAPQGNLDFLTEAEILGRVHHKFLVSLRGYCIEGSYVALVYKYMPGGTLQEHLQGERGNSAPLSWRQRIRIAVESAQGLEYLHKGCNPRLIHRDVKTSNILLTANLEAKIADFGLSKPMHCDTQTHVTTKVVGTPGYYDPEYHMTSQLTEKSDVYSFGVVLLELITGQKALIRTRDRDSENVESIVHWVRQKLATGNIESIVDQRMRGDYDVNSVWKVADLALKCTKPYGSQRPAMPEVVLKLRECIELEATGDSKYYTGSGRSSSNGTGRSGRYYSRLNGNGNTTAQGENFIPG